MQRANSSPSSSSLAQPSTKPTPIGIDFGTTTSLTAVLGKTGDVRVIPTSTGEHATPSALFFGESVLVGSVAVERASDERGDYAEAFKRDIGSSHYSRRIRDYWAPPEVLAAFTLEQLKTNAEAKLGPIGKAVITVPAYYDERRRHATLAAGKLAGLDVADLINEPTAAALAHLYEQRELGQTPENFQLPYKKLMVYDLGGGTFDVSILETGGRAFRTLATDGDVRLGGHDFDDRLVDHAAEKFIAAHGVDPRADWKARHKLALLCRRMKHDLSAHASATGVYHFANMQLEFSVTRVEFEEMLEPMIDRTLTTCGEALTQAELQWSDIDDLLLVGGSCRIPFVAECLAAKTGKQPRLVDAPEEAVARGAAIYAATQTGDQAPSLKVVNVNAHSLGVPGVDLSTSRRINKIMIPRNTPLPASATRRYVTRSANQRTVKVGLMEGESENPKHCTRVANCIAQLEPGLPEQTEVIVTCRYDSKGTISATAVVPSTQARAHVEVQREGMVELDPLSVWRTRLTLGDDPSGLDSAPELTESARIAAWSGAKKLLKDIDLLHGKIGRQCASIVVPDSAEPTRRALISAEQELRATEELRQTVDRRLQRENRDHAKAKLQGDAALLGMYSRQSEAAIQQLYISLGRECAALDFFPAEAGVSREALSERRAALLAAS